MIVEFAGIPGAGKTTVMPIVKETLEAAGLAAMTRWEARDRCLDRAPLARRLLGLLPGRARAAGRRLAWKLSVTGAAASFACAHWLLARQIIGFQRRRPVSWFRRYKTLRGFFAMAGETALFRGRLAPAEAVILDEGTVQQSVNLYVAETGPFEACRLPDHFRLLPWPDLLIHLKCSPGAGIERVLCRGLPNRLEGKSLPEIARFMDNAGRLSQLLSDRLRETGSDAIEVRSDGSMEGCAVELRDRLAKFLHEANRARVAALSRVDENGEARRLQGVRGP